MRLNAKIAIAKHLVLVFLISFIVPIFATAPAAKAAAFNSGPGRSWDVYAQAVGGGPVVASQPMEVVVTLKWDSPMYMYAYYAGNSGTYRLIGNASNTRVPDVYWSGNGPTSPTSAVTDAVSASPESGLSYFKLSADFLTATYVFRTTAPATLTGKYVYSYSRGTPFWNDSYNYSYTSNFDLTTAPPTSSVSKGSLNFDGSNYLTVPASSDWNFGTGDFTVEWWQKYGTQSSAHPRVFSIGCVSGTRLQVSIEVGKFYVAAGSTWAMSPAPATSTYVNTWSHFALVRYSGNLYLYQNGKSLGSVANSTSLNLSSYELYVGEEGASCLGSKFVGDLTDFRISKYAVYTTAFNPRTQLSSYPDTLFLLNANQDAPTVDSSTYARSVTNQGSVSSSASYPPPRILLSTTSISATVATAITTLTTTPGDGMPSSYSISPSLPTGLNFSTVSGSVSGTPTVASASTTYTITANGVTGSPTATFTLAVAAFKMLMVPPSLALTSGSETSSVTVSFSSYTNAVNGTNNASSFTARVYQSDGTTLVGSARTNFTSGTTITGLSAGTLYKVTLQAIGDGTNFLSSNESSPSSIVTYPASVTRTINHNAGRALHASATFGQTFKTAVGKGGSLVSISNMHLSFRDTFIGTVGAKIYTNPSKTTLLGTSSDICADTDNSGIYPNGASPDFNGPDCSFSFSGVTLAENTSYYFEVYRITGGSSFFLYESYDGEGSPYADGDVYLYGSSSPTASYDVKFVITLEGTLMAPTLTGASISGTKVDGKTLTASVSGAGGDPATTTTYQWQSSSDGTNFSNIGTDSSTYTLTSSEIGKVVRVSISVSNGAGSNSATSTATSTIAAAPTITSVTPSNGTTAGGTTFTIVGTNLTGTSTVVIGNNSATSVTVVDSATVTAVSPSFATPGALNVILTRSDGGTVTSTGGFTYVAPPSVTAATINGTVTVGTLLGSSYSATGTNLSMSYQWKQSSTSAGTYTDIAGATSAGFTPTFDLAGKYLKLTVTATNVIGTSSFTSNASTRVGNSVYVDLIPDVYAGSGTSWDPIAGNTSTGFTLVNSPTYVSASGGNSGYFSLNGTSTQWMYDKSGLVSPPTTFSLAIWFRVSSGYTGKLIGLETVQNSQGLQYDRHLYIGNDGKLYWGVYSTSSKIVGSNSAVDNGSWHYAVVTFTSSTSNLYLDGVAQGTSLSGAAFGYPGSTTYWKIGGTQLSSWSYAASNYLTGDIGRVTIFTTALTSGVVSNYYSSQSSAYANGSPTITSISPNQGPVAGGTSVTITGTNLTGTTGVTFGGSSATNVTVNSSTSVTVTTPAKTAGAVDVTLSTSVGSVTSSGAYTYLSSPTISSISPNTGALAGGTTVTISGTGFASGATVKFGSSNAASVTVNSSTQITAVTPSGSAGTVNIVITNTDTGTVTATSAFTYAALPTITSLSVTSGTTSGGTSVTISGTNLSGVTGITFGGTSGTSISSNTSTSVTVVTPAKSAGAVNVVLTTAGGSVTATNAYTYTSAPTISGATISGTAAVGQTLTASAGTINQGGLSTTTSYQWQSASSGGTYSNIDSATSSTYVVTSSEVGKTLKVIITVTNSISSATATSSATSAVLGSLTTPSAPTLAQTTGSISTSITVSFSSVTNASSYTVRVYQSDGTTLVGSARANFSSGSAVSGLTPGTTYKFTVQAIGDGTTYSSSAESSQASLATDSGFVNLTITQNVGQAQHATNNWGQTFTVPAGTSGTLTSISNMHMAFRGTFVGTVDAKIYTSTNKSTLLGTATNTCSDTDSTLGGQVYADFNGPDCTFYFTGVSLSSNTSYYFEINRLSGGSTFYLWEYYASGGTLYTGGQNYENGTAYPDWDLKFTINYSGTPPDAPTLTGAAISGTASQGQTLTASVQGAGGGAASTTAYQWMRADTSGGTFTNIAGATNSTYLLGTNDAFKYLKVKITVTNAGGSNNATSSETSQIAAPSIIPTITSITKNAGNTAGGITVTITGTNMSAVTAVTFDGSAATISSKTATTVVVVTPAHAAGAVNVVVTNPSGSATSVNGYTYVTPPVASSWTTSLSRTTASLNDTVTVTYRAVCTTPQNYGPSMYDLLYVTGGSWTYNSYMGSGTSTDGGYTWTITKTYTLNSTGIWKVDAYERGACWDSYNFTYAPRNTINVGVPGPTITSLATTSGPAIGGTAVVLTGTNLTGVTAVTVGGSAATSIRTNTSTSVTFNTPSGTAGAKDVVVTTAAGSVTSANAFTYVAPVTITYDTNTATSGSPSRSSDLYTPNSGGYALPTVGTMVKTGHTFSGWTTVFDSTTALTSPYNPSTSKTLYAIWTARDYTITYNANGATSGSAPSASLNTYGSSVNLADNSGGSALVRTGYTPAGWIINGVVYNFNANGAFNMPAENLIAYANWQINTYSVTYDKNGSADATPATQSGINANGTVTLAAGVTKASYAFVGWEENGVTYAAGATYRIGSADVTMVAKWIPIYTVSYNLNGTGATGTVPIDVLKSDGDTLTVTSNVPTRSGYTFGGWVDQSGGAHASGSTYTINSSNYLLYGVWTANSYMVTYALAGGNSALPTESAKTYKASFNLAAAPTKTGYTFTGWSDSSTVYSALSSYLMPASDVTLTAQWSVNAYTITYDLAQGTSSVPVPVNKNFGDQWNLPSAPTRVGYNFVNWSDGTNTFAAGAQYTLNSASNLTITAVWSAIVYYTVTYDLDGGLGTAPTQDPLQNGQSFNLAADPSKTGYSFTGWSYAGNTYTSGSTINMPASNITITATWTATSAGTYAITYVTNGAQTPAPTIPALSQSAVFTVDDGSTLIKTGYNFSGWSSSGVIYNGGETVTVGTSNITFSALWAPSSRSTYVSNSTDATTITKGRSITVTYSLGCYNSSTLPSITEKVTSTGESFINDITNYLTVVDAGYNWTVTRVYTLSYAGTYTIMATASGGCFSADTDSTPETVVVTEAPSSGGSGGSGNVSNSNTGNGSGGSSSTGSIPPVTVVGAKVALVANKYYTLPKLAANTTVSVAAKAGATATATTTNANGSTTTAATTMLAVNNAAKGLSEVKIVENQLAVVPTVGFSGKTSVSVTVTDGVTTSSIDVPVTVLPEPVKDPVITPKTSTTTVVNWDASPNATNYQVFVDGKSVCKTSGESCTINKILGPNANVDVIANGGDATKSEIVDAGYHAPTVVTIAKVSGTYGKSTLSKNDINNLNKVIATIEKQGFETVQISNITTTKATATAAKARLDAMVNYIKTKVDNPDLVVNVVAPTTRTFTNQIAVK